LTVLAIFPGWTARGDLCRQRKEFFTTRFERCSFSYSDGNAFATGNHQKEMLPMPMSAQISVYPLRQDHLSPAIETVRRALEAHGLQPEVGPMSTLVTGAVEDVFAALQEAFTQAAATGQVVMTITLSNACPI
jgi:uncharacterized protein YqgV (UPF0045/DUF77 family)